MGTAMNAQLKSNVSWRVVFLSYCVGAIVCLLTQMVVMMEHGPRVYVSVLWGLLYPVSLFIADTFTRIGLALHVPIKSTTAAGIGVAGASAAFGLVVPALVGLTRLSKRPVRYLGFALLAIFSLLALFWGVLPNVF
jgi:hypothetical protein